MPFLAKYESRSSRQVVAQCEMCAKFGISQQKETLMPHKLPTRPRGKVANDLFECVQELHVHGHYGLLQ